MLLDCVIPEGAGPCQRAVCCGAGCFRACVTGVCCFPGSCHVRGERPGGSRTGRSPAAGGGAAGVLEVTGREPDDLAAGNGSRVVRGMFGCSGPSHSWVRLCGQCRWLQSSLRVPPARGAGAAWGGSASEEAVRRGQSRGRPRCRVRAAGQTQEAASRLAAGQEELFMPPAQAAGSPAGWREMRAGSGSARRAGRKRSG